MPVTIPNPTDPPTTDQLTTDQWRKLEDKAHELRQLTVNTVVWGGSGHIGGSLSSTDILTVLYHHVLRFDPQRLDWPERDRFILSKGHIGVGFAPVLADLGCFELEWLHRYNQTGSPLGMHLDRSKVPGLEASTGSLGHGLPIAVGLALGARLQQQSWRTFTLLGDGECNEGSVWEAAMSAAHYQLTNLIAIVDRNRAMIDGPTEEVMRLEPFADKWRAFGWQVIEVDGHDLPALVAACAATGSEGRPTVIIANTIKGAGVDFIAGDYTWHYGALDSEKHEKALASLERYHTERLAKVKEN